MVKFILEQSKGWCHEPVRFVEIDAESKAGLFQVLRNQHLDE